MKPLRVLLILTCALIGLGSIGCGPGAVDQATIPHPEREKAIDVTNPAFQKLEGKGARP